MWNSTAHSASFETQAARGDDFLPLEWADKKTKAPAKNEHISAAGKVTHLCHIQQRAVKALKRLFLKYLGLEQAEDFNFVWCVMSSL